MICTATFTYLFVVLFIIGDLTILIYAAYIDSKHRPPFCIILVTTILTGIVVWMLLHSTCNLEYVLWGAGTLGLLACFLLNELLTHCFHVCFVDIPDEFIV